MCDAAFARGCVWRNIPCTGACNETDARERRDETDPLAGRGAARRHADWADRSQRGTSADPWHAVPARLDRRLGRAHGARHGDRICARSGESGRRAMNIALVLLAIAAAVALLLGVLASSGKKMGVEQWAVGGRGFGWIFVFLLLAGEIYTTFTFLGASGFAYGLGAPAYYILAYGALAYVIAYFMLPPIWAYARTHGLHSQPDFFTRKYDSRTLGALVSLVDLVALLPYLVLQLTGLGIIVVAAGY